MALSIKKEEAMDLLHQNKRHYLWNRSFARWTAKDIQNLRAGININHGNVLRERKPRTAEPYKIKETKSDVLQKTPSKLGRKVLVITPQGEIQKFVSVIEAGEATGVKLAAIYNLLNGRPADSCGYQFMKF